ncbi:MAG: hypothetical protein JST04_12385 [Bdellovibrionales bacterium]|nr:hypothetical protein [Bdellovibrionales bacterium]
MKTQKARLRALAIFVVSSLLFAGESLAKFAPDLGRETFHTAHFRVHYPPHYRALAEAFGDRLENSYVILRRELGWEPSTKTEVVLRGDTDVPNGAAEVFPYNRLVLNAVAPEPWGFFSESDDWIGTLALHELTHVMANDETSGFFSFQRSFMGSAAKINPYQPAWLVEGLAVYEETTKTTRGRGRSVWNDMVVRTAMTNGLFDPGPGNLRISLDRLNDGIRPWPGAHAAYLYGYLLTEEMASIGGPDAPARISLANSGTLPFFIEGVARETIGRGYPDLWDSTVKKLRPLVEADVAKIDREPRTPMSTITHVGRRTRGIAASDRDHIYFIRDSERDGVGLSVIDRGGIRNLTDWRWDGGSRLRRTYDGKYLMYSRYVPYREHSLYSDVFLYEIATGREIQLTSGARAIDPEPTNNFAWDEKADLIETGTFFYVKNLDDGNQAIARVYPSGRRLREDLIYAGKDFARLGAPAYHLGRGEWIAFSEQPRGAGEHLRVLNIDNPSENFALSEENSLPGERARDVMTTPEWDTNGSLLYVGSVGGVFNLNRIREPFSTKPTTNRITNVMSGVLQPTRPFAGAPLYALVYSPFGWNLGIVEPDSFYPAGPRVTNLEKKMGVSASSFPASESVPPASREEADYSVFPALWPKYWAPDLRKVTDGWTLGVQTSSYDAWENHRYRLYGGRDTRAPFAIWDLNYQYDGFNPTLELSVRRENRYFATYAESNRIDTDSARVYMPAGWDSLVTLGFTRTASEYFSDTETSGGFELGWIFDRMRTFDDSIDSTGERGLRGRAGLTGYFVGPARFSAFESRIDLRVPSPLPRHFFRLGANYAAANNEKLSAFYFVGGGEETIAGESDYLLRGYPQGTVYGRKILTSNFEYVFPVLDVFRGIGTLPAYFESTRLKLFFDAGSAEYVGNDLRSFHRWPTGAGAHVLSDFNFFYRVPVTVAFGFDYGFTRDLGGESRFVVGLFSRVK